MKFFCRLCSSEEVVSLINLDGFPIAAQHFLIDSREADDAVVLNVVQCKSCGLTQLSNHDPVPYYKDVITAASLSEASKNKIIQEWTALLNRHSLQKGSALEIGAGKGDFVDVLNRLNFAASGIENSVENVRHAQEAGLRVDCGYILDEDYSVSAQHSLIVCNNFLEHQPSPNHFIKKMYQLLRDDGMLYVSVPNLDYLLAKSCLYEFVADHLVYFTESTLKRAFESNGFEVLEQYKKNNDNDLVLVAKKRTLDNYDCHINRVEQIKKSLKDVIKNYHSLGKRICIWGAGHRALALMALAGLIEIEFVVDSASFKQGKYTPLLKKKIISPEELLVTGCDFLLVMLPGSYSDQVVEFLNVNKLNCDVAIFNDSPNIEILRRAV